MELNMTNTAATPTTTEQQIWYAIKTLDNNSDTEDKAKTYFRTTDYTQCNRMLNDVKSFGKRAWVDLQDSEGKPHPCLD